MVAAGMVWSKGTGAPNEQRRLPHAVRLERRRHVGDRLVYVAHLTHAVRATHEDLALAQPRRRCLSGHLGGKDGLLQVGGVAIHVHVNRPLRCCDVVGSPAFTTTAQFNAASCEHHWLLLLPFFSTSAHILFISLFCSCGKMLAPKLDRDKEQDAQWAGSCCGVRAGSARTLHWGVSVLQREIHEHGRRARLLAVRVDELHGLLGEEVPGVEALVPSRGAVPKRGGRAVDAVGWAAREVVRRLVPHVPSPRSLRVSPGYVAVGLRRAAEMREVVLPPLQEAVGEVEAAVVGNPQPIS